VAHKSDTATPTPHCLALTLPLESLGLRSIGRIVGFRHAAIYQWVKACGEQVGQITRSTAYIVELDELHRYVGQTKTSAESGLLLIDLENAFAILSLGRKAS